MRFGASTRRLRSWLVPVAAFLCGAVFVVTWVTVSEDWVPRDGGSAASGPVLAPVREFTRAVETPVLLQPLEQAPRVVLLPRGGRITSVDVSSGEPLRSGSVLAAADGVPLVLLSTSVPFYRILSSGASGTDVRALQEEIGRLGFDPGRVDGRFGSATIAALNELRESLGLGKAERFDPSLYAWLPIDGLVVGDVELSLGAIHGAETVAVTEARPVTEFRVESVGAALGELAPPVSVVVAGEEFIVDIEKGTVSDPRLAALLAAGSGTSNEAVARSGQGEDVMVVPASAVLTDASGRTCVLLADGAQPRTVDVVRSLAGVVEITPDSSLETVLADVTEIGPTSTCG